MYDNIEMWKELNSRKQMYSIAYNLDGDFNETYLIEKDTPVISGKLGNARIRADKRNLSIKLSLSKFLNGHNLIDLTRKKTKKAVKELERRLQIDLTYAKMTRMEIGSNLNMKNDVSLYLPYIGGLPRYNRFLLNSTLYYSTKSKHKIIKFYDKLKDVRAKNEFVPLHFLNKNILRFEVSYKNRLSSRLKCDSPIYLHMLYKKQFYNYMKELLKIEYKKIHKNPEFPVCNSVRTPRDFINYFAVLKTQDLGIDRTCEIIDEFKTRNLFNSYTYPSNTKRTIRDLMKKFGKKPKASLIEELDAKILKR